MNYTKGEIRVERRHNFEPGGQLPSLKWRLTHKSHQDALPKMIALIDSKANAYLFSAAPKLAEALNELMIAIEHWQDAIISNDAQAQTLAERDIRIAYNSAKPALAKVEGRE